MTDAKVPIALVAAQSPMRKTQSNYPEPFFSRMSKREKQVLGDQFGLTNFGVNLTRLKPGGESALMHRHFKQDEFIYVLEGAPTLLTDTGEIQLHPGMCAGFPAMGVAHHLVNRSDADATYLEIGDRSPGDGVEYPNDDIAATQNGEGKWVFTRKDGCRF